MLRTGDGGNKVISPDIWKFYIILIQNKFDIMNTLKKLTSRLLILTNATNGKDGKKMAWLKFGMLIYSFCLMGSPFLILWSKTFGTLICAFFLIDFFESSNEKKGLLKIMTDYRDFLVNKCVRESIGNCMDFATMRERFEHFAKLKLYSKFPDLNLDSHLKDLINARKIKKLHFNYWTILIALLLVFLYGGVFVNNVKLIFVYGHFDLLIKLLAIGFTYIVSFSILYGVIKSVLFQKDDYIIYRLNKMLGAK